MQRAFGAAELTGNGGHRELGIAKIQRNKAPHLLSENFRFFHMQGRRLRGKLEQALGYTGKTMFRAPIEARAVRCHAFKVVSEDRG